MGVGVDDMEVDNLASTFGCAKCSLPFYYLGMPVGGGMCRKGGWENLIKKFQAKLSNWKARCLSFGGRLILCKSVLGSLGSYLFSLYKASKVVINKLESIRCRLFWGGGADTKKIAWVKWKRVLNDKSCGGLNIGSLKALNLALLGKWWWRFKVEPDALWRKTIVSIHGNDGNLGGVARNGCWGQICKLNNNLGLGNVDLRSLFFEDNGTWNWGLEDDGIYTVASLRKLIDENNLDRMDQQTVWFKQIPGKANILLWRASIDRLPTRRNLVIRGIHIPSTSCPLCNSFEETGNHLFLLCSLSTEVLNGLKVWFPDLLCNRYNISELLKDLQRDRGLLGVIRVSIHVALIWVVWRYRNDVIHAAVSRVSSTAIAMEVKILSYNWVKSRVNNLSFVNWEAWALNPVSACNPLN